MFAQWGSELGASFINDQFLPRQAIHSIMNKSTLVSSPRVLGNNVHFRRDLLFKISDHLDNVGPLNLDPILADSFSKGIT